MEQLTQKKKSRYRVEFLWHQVINYVKLQDLIDMIDQGNKSSGGVKIVCPKVYGIIGMVYYNMYNLEKLMLCIRLHSIFEGILHAPDLEAEKSRRNWTS
jgi:hypothetical protein